MPERYNQKAKAVVVLITAKCNRELSSNLSSKNKNLCTVFGDLKVN
jgi:hypothetical protein